MTCPVGCRVRGAGVIPGRSRAAVRRMSAQEVGSGWAGCRSAVQLPVRCAVRRTARCVGRPVVRRPDGPTVRIARWGLAMRAAGLAGINTRKVVVGRTPQAGGA